MQYAVWFYGVGVGMRRFFNTYPELTLAIESAERLLKIDWVASAVIVRQTVEERTSMDKPVVSGYEVQVLCACHREYVTLTPQGNFNSEDWCLACGRTYRAEVLVTEDVAARRHVTAPNN